MTLNYFRGFYFSGIRLSGDTIKLRDNLKTGRAFFSRGVVFGDVTGRPMYNIYVVDPASLYFCVIDRVLTLSHPN